MDHIIIECSLDDVLYVNITRSTNNPMLFVLNSEINDGYSVKAYEKVYSSPSEAINEYLEIISNYVKNAAGGEVADMAA